MSKYSRFLIILLVILLAGCNRPQPQPKQLPSDTSIPPLESSTSTVSPPETVILQTLTPKPEPTKTDPPPPEPTIDITQALQGDLIPLLPAGADLTLHKIDMVDGLTGWAIGVADSETEHILRTSDGGYTWQDVTPPQPQGEYTTYVYTGFANENTAWVNYIGSNLIWSTHDGGITWGVVPVEFSTMGGAMFSVFYEDHAWLFQFLDAGMQKVYTASYRTTDGGDSWTKLLDPYEDISIQGFDKTGAMFANPINGWLTRDFRGVLPQVHLNITQDGGKTWETLDIPPPPSRPDIFDQSACGLYYPNLTSPLQGSVFLVCSDYDLDQITKSQFYYKTVDDGFNWDIYDAPQGYVYHINAEVLYTISDYIYRSEDGGQSWDPVKSVYWEGQFSFIDRDTAWAVAYDQEDNEYALVKTTDGCNSFSIIEPELITSTSIR